MMISILEAQTLDYWMTISILEASDTGLLDDDQYTGGFRH